MDRTPKTNVKHLNQVIAKVRPKYWFDPRSVATSYSRLRISISSHISKQPIIDKAMCGAEAVSHMFVVGTRGTTTCGPTYIQTRNAQSTDEPYTGSIRRDNQSLVYSSARSYGISSDFARHNHSKPIQSGVMKASRLIAPYKPPNMPFQVWTVINGYL